MTDAEEQVDSYRHFRHLRRKSPVLKLEEGPWQIARYDDVQRVLRDSTTFSSDVSTRPPEERRSPSMLFSDAPIHNRLRKLVSFAFKPAHIESQRTLITKRCEELVVAMAAQPRSDLVQSLAAPLPVTVIAHMLGVADGDIVQFKQWSDAIFSNIGDILFATPSPAAVTASEEMNAYFLARIAEIRKQPADHLLGRLIETETEDGRLSNEEILSFCSLLLIAGNETTTGLITASVRVFDEIPETFAQLKKNPTLIPTFVEEALRYYSPFSVTVRRTLSDTVIADTTIKKGELVLPLIASANRDETIFENPDKFIIDRNPNPHLAFGFGIHFCLGAHLARLEGEIAVASMIKHLDGISLAAESRSSASELGGPSELWVLTP
jgi:cytochrome P450